MVLALLKRLWKDEKGQAMSEYGIVLAIIAVGAIAALTALSGKIAGVFSKIGTALQGL